MVEIITPRALFIWIVTAAVVIQVATSATYNVGGPNGGWDLGTNLQSWSLSVQQLFQGDTLVFTYGPSHDVVEVPKVGYDSCSASNPIQSYAGGSTTITLLAPGKRYFICGIPGHCAGGMKLQVDVLSAAVASSPPAASAPPKPSTSARAPTTSDSELVPSVEQAAASPLVMTPAASPPTMQSAASAAGLARIGMAELAVGLTMMALT